MKSPVVMASPFQSPIPSSSSANSPQAGGLVVGRRSIQRGLLARAANYANNAAKGNSLVTQFNGVNLPERDPIVWGDASNRYRMRRNEENEINNNGIQASAIDVSGSPEGVHSPLDSLDPLINESEWQNGEHVTSSPFFPGSNDVCNAENDIVDGRLDSEISLTSYTNSLDDQNRLKPVDSAIDSKEVKRLSFNTTQQLRSGFFRSIKRQYSPILPLKDDEKPRLSGSLGSESASSSASSNNDGNNDSDGDNEEEARDNFSANGQMSQLAKQKLDNLRRQGPGNVDVSTGLQWIRLELHEMREQDKSLFLQLIKLHSTIKELKSDISGSQEFSDYDDLHSAASLWWPRRGYSSTMLPDFSSSDGAQIFRSGRSKPPLRRGFSLNYPPTGRSIYGNSSFMNPGLTRNVSIDSEQSLLSTDSSSITIRSATAC